MKLCDLGHLATTTNLRAQGWTRTDIATADVVRIRRGVYACRHLAGPPLLAARVGGALTGVSVLREARVWTGHDRRVHIQVPPSASARHTFARVHWEPPRFGMETPWRASRMQALWQAIRCLPAEDALGAMESAIHRGFLTETEVRRLGALAPRRLQPLIRRLISTSGSGNETIARIRLLEAGYPVTAQGRVPGLGHQDLVVEDCVGLEVDSEEWHGEQARAVDYARDLISEGLGRPVLRILPEHIHESWPQTLAVIDRMVRDSQRRDAYRGPIATR